MKVKLIKETRKGLGTSYTVVVSRDGLYEKRRFATKQTALDYIQSLSRNP